jgi:ribonucleoside-diphosphate reductase alpha chain
MYVNSLDNSHFPLGPRGPRMNHYLFELDQAHQAFDLFSHPFSQEIWGSKYRYKDDTSIRDTFMRIAKAVYASDLEGLEPAYDAMAAGLWMPGGRIIAGAGTEKRVTLMNCYVNKQIGDSLDDIMEGVKIAALTQQQGGGIGTDFSTLRPTGAILRRTGARASGPLPFMDMWHSMCSTIMSAGDRRGAMMGTIIDTHPDLLDFITAKQQPNRLTNFNVSVLVTDAFMEAVKEDEDWMLHFPVPPYSSRPQSLVDLDFEEEGAAQYVYSVHKARDLWTTITRNTYDWSEPGVIFIDRVNDLNNLQYCEHIQCTNPCGEQPLPPNGTCNLGAINLSRLVKSPYSDEAELNFELLTKVAKTGMRFLDNVIDVTNYPMPEQKDEELQKRRTGLGVSGLGDALAQLRLRYGSPAALELTDKIFYTICQAAYTASADLAQERGPFPLYSSEFLERGFAANKLDFGVLEKVKAHGLRNGVLLTVAPTGTTSILYGDISSGIEPIFALKTKRNVRQSDNSFKQFETESFSLRFFKHCQPSGAIPSYMVTVDDLTVEDHITTQAAVQKWVDASVSKTVNCPKELTYEQFTRVYDLAYSLGAKGCTTYRPSETRGAILVSADTDERPTTTTKLRARPDELFGRTRKIRWPTLTSSLYLTVNYDEGGTPYEAFFNCKDSRFHDWHVATSLMITSILRKGGDTHFIADELRAVTSLHDTAFIQGPGDSHPRNYGSLISLVGAHLSELLVQSPWGQTETVHSTHNANTSLKERCPQCGGFTLIHKEGCKICENCSYSDCG